MKIRNGFVSNSSSSSFIIGITNTGKDGEGHLFDPTDNIGWPLEMKESKDGKYILRMESFNYDVVSCKIEPGDHYVYLDGVGPDGDESFSVYVGDDWSHMDYDVELEDFDNCDIDNYNKINSLGGETSYGAGRNG